MACPACGGAGGGPFGRAGAGWDLETYECVRCQGSGVVLVRDEEARAARPGVAKARPDARVDAPAKRAAKS